MIKKKKPLSQIYQKKIYLNIYKKNNHEGFNES